MPAADGPARETRPRSLVQPHHWYGL